MTEPGPAFSVKGSRNGSLVTVFWEPGSLAGDPPTVDLVLAQLEVVNACLDDEVCDPELGAIVRGGGGDPLAEPWSAYALLELTLDTIRSVDGHPGSLISELRRRRETTTKAKGS
jgi:hypothetical protein